MPDTTTSVHGRTLYSWFADSARRTPDAPALNVQGQVLSYRELRNASDALARAVESSACSVPDRIGLLAARSSLAYAGYLAVLRLGAAVVPLNPLFPAKRNAAIVDRARVPVVVADPSAVLALTEQPERDGGWRSNPLPQTGRLLHRPADDAPDSGALPTDDVAYILFTSGSTGRPKGMPLRHGNISAYLDHVIGRYDIGPGCRLSQTFDLTFDPSLFDMFAAWGSGASVVVPRREDLSDPAAFVNEHNVSHWFSVPSVVSLATRMRRLPAGCMPQLRWSLFAGEQLTIDQARSWQWAAPASTVENIYGPTELTVTCTGYRLPQEPSRWSSTRNGTVPIGDSYPHLEHVVLDSEGRRAREGELCVRGAQRFDGYLDAADDVSRFISLDPADGRPAQMRDSTAPLTTAHWFRTGDRVAVGDDGALVHLGRLDSQVQVHGYRVELGEIEAALRHHPLVDEIVVLVDGAELRAIYTGSPTGPDDLARWLRRTLPPFMVPRHFTCVDALPLNDNGKLDRRRLEALTC